MQSTDDENVIVFRNHVRGILVEQSSKLDLNLPVGAVKSITESIVDSVMEVFVKDKNKE